MFVYMCLVYADELIKMECKSHFGLSRCVRNHDTEEYVLFVKPSFGRYNFYLFFFIFFIFFYVIRVSFKHKIDLF